MIYPVFIIFVFLVVISIIVVFVIPQLSQFLKESGQDLPFLTKVVMAVSDFLRTKGWTLLILFALLGTGLYFFIKSKKGKIIFDRAILKVPFIKSFFKKFYLTRFALNLSTLISGGLPITKALEITSEVVGNSVYKEVIVETTDEVKKGERMSSVLEKHSEVIFPLFFQMIMVGEKTGSIDSTLKNVVEFYQKDIDNATDNFIKLLEPILIIVLGGMVGGLVFAVLMPIYSFPSF